MLQDVSISKHDTYKDVSISKHDTYKDVSIYKHDTYKDISIYKHDTYKDVSISKHDTYKDVSIEDPAYVSCGYDRCSSYFSAAHIFSRNGMKGMKPSSSAGSQSSFIRPLASSLVSFSP